MSGERAPMTRMILLAVVMAAGETAWAFYCGVTGVNLAVFYAVLVLASSVFFIPGIAEPRGSRRP